MAKHVAPPATAAQIRQTLGITPEDMEIVQRLLGKIGECDDPPALCEPVKAEEWPDDFWRAFEGMPEGFERPAQVPQKREADFVSSSDSAINRLRSLRGRTD